MALENAGLWFAFHVPNSVLAAHSRVKLRARVGGRELPQAVYESKGNQEYKALIGPLPAGLVRVDFELEHALGPNSSDLRELGIRVRFSGPPPVGIV